MTCRAIQAFFAGIFFMFFVGLIVPPTFVFAQSEAERLQDKINDLTEDRKEFERKIAELESQLKEVGAEKSTLQSAINKLELERKKVEADISYTQNQIGATDLQISKLDYEIDDTEATIERDKEVVGQMLRKLNETDQDLLIVSMLRYENLSEFWNEIAELERVRDTMRTQVSNLIDQKYTLEDQLGNHTNKRVQLVGLKNQYSDQNQVLEQNKATKNQLLERTKSEEAAYQAQLAEQRAAYEQILSNIRSFESELQFILDPTSIPSAGSKVFSWPLQNVIITQYFGGTEFASRNASVYGGRAYHPGLDLGASVGTKIYAPLSGTVRATGNTDAVAGCYSWGKWTLIDHPNGLSTLYAHQSVISVSPGQSVSTGDIIGYTGNTGYTTGPHLHFTVYAKDGVSVKRFNEIKAVTSCGGATTPVAATDAYLDPMNYLPAY